MTQNTRPTGFLLNGLPLGPQPGAPFADPAVDDNGKPINVDPTSNQQRKRVYKAAAIQLNVRLNKLGWHFPQQRILTLWNDVKDTLAKQGAEAMIMTPAEFDAFVRAETEKMAKLVKQSGARAD